MDILIYLKEFEDFDITDPKAFLFRGIVDARSLKFQESWSVPELSRYLFPICPLFVIRSCDTELGQLPCSFLHAEQSIPMFFLLATLRVVGSNVRSTSLYRTVLFLPEGI